MERKRAWLYCRVAHDGPDSGWALEGQRLRLETYAKEHGFEIAGCSSDIGSGLTLERPGLLDFHATIKGMKVDILLLHSLSRLGRDTNKVIGYWRLLRDLGISIHTADFGEVDLSSSMMFPEMIGEMRKRSR
ncbi:MAG: recombinase family protein [Lachnospiraceae bacterium]|nr:recombinase family protein [Lachnospiraceae bacterium]